MDNETAKVLRTAPRKEHEAERSFDKDDAEFARTTVTIKRVIYGKRETLLADREYRIADNTLSPVGSLADWIAWANGLIIAKRVRVIDTLMGEDYFVEL